MSDELLPKPLATDTHTHTHTEMVWLHHYAPALPQRLGADLLEWRWATAVTASHLLDLLI